MPTGAALLRLRGVSTTTFFLLAMPFGLAAWAIPPESGTLDLERSRPCQLGCLAGAAAAAACFTPGRSLDAQPEGSPPLASPSPLFRAHQMALTLLLKYSGLEVDSALS